MKDEAKKTKKVTVQVTSIFQALVKIQRELKAPKSKWNDFSKFNYRSCGDILEAVKPLLSDGYFLTLSDEIVQVGERYYVKATAKLSNGKESIVIQAFARESLDKKGMDEAQITGATSSYARKYALNGLFAIDDAKDADTDGKKEKVNVEKLLSATEMKALAGILQSITNAKNIEELDAVGETINADIKAKKVNASQVKVLREAYGGKKKKLEVQPRG